MRLLPSLVVVWLISCIHPLLAQDVTPPVLFCPTGITIELDPGDCETIVTFTVFATDNTSTPTISQIDNTGLSSGDEFPIGTTTLSFMAEDTSGNADTCSFDVVIIEFEPPTPGLACDDNLHISIPSTCEMWLTPAMVLEGDYGCYDDFVVDVEYTGSSYINQQYVGETITYTVTNTQTGNICWGYALVEDKSGPWIQNCNDVTVTCLQDTRPVTEGGDIPVPTFSDCNDFSVIYMDMATQGECDDDYAQQIMRMWTATDELGHISTCNQMIFVERVLLSEMTPDCPSTFMVECTSGITPDFSPEVAGYPFDTIGGVVYQITDNANSFCNITASYTDQIQDKCGASYHIIRHWTVIDWCSPLNAPGNPWTCTQILKYRDTTPPVIIPPANMTVSANLPGCKARPIIPASVITDCSGYTVSISTPVGPIVGNGGQVPAPGLPYGTHTLTVKATDECGNSSTATFTVHVVDNLKPTPVCDAHTIVALDDQGYGHANATSFDDGSTDNCCVDEFKAARMTDNCHTPPNLGFGDQVQFCCADVGQTIQVVLRIYDCHGNYNECMVQVEVQDKSGPSITCPPNKTLLCGDDYTDFDLTGEVVLDPAQQGANDGYAYDNCTNVTVSHSDNGTVTCGSGLILRTWKATDVAGQMATCTQKIQVNNNNVFTGNNITWPVDITVNGCSSQVDPVNTGVPALPPASPCHNLMVSSVDEVYNNVNGACKKILRHWIVIDWCQYNPNIPNSPGRWEHVQTIKVIDGEAPVFTSCDNRTFCNFKPHCEDIAPDLSVAAQDACTPVAQLTYSWTVDLFNDGVADTNPDYAYSGNGQNTINWYPTGTHRINYSVTDGCGNTGYCHFLFTIEDCKKPTVICETGVIVEMMQGGQVSVNVMSLEEGSSSDNCSDREDLLFSFSPDTDDTEATFYCTDLGQNLVQVWVTDEAGNQDFCETTVIIQDNMNACGGGTIDPLIALNGLVANEENEGVENVSVELNGNMSSQTLTNGTGGYQFANLPVGYDYTVTPLFDQGLLNGVTTFDLVLLHRHVLGMELLDSPYKVIAGDINHSGLLTVSDVVDLRKVILNIEDHFPNNTSWRFVDGAYAFPDPLHPFNPAFPEVCNVNDLTPNSPAVNFVAVKIGDLNGTAVANSLPGSIEERSGIEIFMTTPDRTVKAGETVSVDMLADPVAMANIFGYQFTLNFDQNALAFEKLTPGPNGTEDNFGMARLEEGAITASLYRLTNTGEAPDADAPQFSVTFTAKAGGKLSEMLSINSRFTKAEGYEADGLRHPIALQFTSPSGSAVKSNEFGLFQNMPNPFSNITVIGFQLPETSAATLTIFDVSGRIVKEIKGEFAKGYHEISLDKSSMPNAGVFYYRLETPKHTATKKMTMI